MGNCFFTPKPNHERIRKGTTCIRKKGKEGKRNPFFFSQQQQREGGRFLAFGALSSKAAT